MGHKVSDGNSIVVTAPAGGVVKDTQYVIDDIFGFADADTDEGELVSLSIGQEEREVTLPAKVGGWAIGDPVFVDGSADFAEAGRFVGRVSREVDAAGGVGWMVVAADAWSVGS